MKLKLIFFTVIILTSLSFAAQAQTTICFNKKFEFYSNVNSKETFGCFYVSTATGYVAQVFSEEECRNGLSNYHPGYTVAIINNQGEAYLYQIDKKGRKTFMPFTMDNLNRGNPTLSKINPSVSGYGLTLSSQNLGVRAYKHPGNANSSVYLHAQTLPATIRINSYLGVFGLGYYKTADRKEYLSLAYEAENIYMRVDNITDVNECIRISDFATNTIEEGTAIQDELLQQKEEDIRLRQQDVNNSPCAQEQQQLINLEKRVNTKTKNANNYYKRNPVVVVDANNETQKMIVDAGNPTDMATKRKLEMELRVCQLYDDIYVSQQNGRQNANSENRKLTQIACLNQARDQLIFLESELQNLDRRYATEASKAQIEKSKHYMRRIKDINTDCNLDRDGNIKELNMNTPEMNQFKQQLQDIMHNR